MTRRCARTPFNHPDADIILRSSDGIDFRVFKIFFSLASPFFKSLFEIPQPVGPNNGQEFRDGLAVIPVVEDSKTLDMLLRFCYPITVVEEPKISKLKDGLRVLWAAIKYSLDNVEKKVCQATLTPKILEAEPLRCFVIAHRARLREETLLAARYTLKRRLTIPSWFPEMELITTADLLSLLAYRRKCGDAVYALRHELSWIRSHYRNLLMPGWYPGYSHYSLTCVCARSTTPKFNLFTFSPQWWEDFMEETFTALQEKPCKETVRASAKKTETTILSKGCPVCSPGCGFWMNDLVELFARKIEKTVSEVDLKLSF